MSRINRDVLKTIRNELNNMKWNTEDWEGVIFYTSDNNIQDTDKRNTELLFKGQAVLILDFIHQLNKCLNKETQEVLMNNLIYLAQKTLKELKQCS